MNKLLIPIQYLQVAIVFNGTLLALTEQYIYHGATLAIAAGILLSVIEDYQYGH